MQESTRQNPSPSFCPLPPSFVHGNAEPSIVISLLKNHSPTEQNPPAPSSSGLGNMKLYRLCPPIITALRATTAPIDSTMKLVRLYCTGNAKVKGDAKGQGQVSKLRVNVKGQGRHTTHNRAYNKTDDAGVATEALLFATPWARYWQPRKLRKGLGCEVTPGLLRRCLICDIHNTKGDPGRVHRVAIRSSRTTPCAPHGYSKIEITQSSSQNKARLTRVTRSIVERVCARACVCDFPPPLREKD